MKHYCLYHKPERSISSLCFGCSRAAHLVRSLHPGAPHTTPPQQYTRAAHTSAWEQGYGKRKDLCFQILGARLLLFQSKRYKVRPKNRSEQQTAIIANFCFKRHNHINVELLDKVFLKHFFISLFSVDYNNFLICKLLPLLF